ncbi:MCE family protein [Candidatus Babeliales bacterium]|nr:MCE family protein [Candidatus Babeliales bacterium]
MQVKTETRVGVFIIIAIGIFFYMTFQIGVFRLDRSNYVQYTVYFEDVSGLQKKSDIKIAGVKVGWVESVDLLQDEMQAKAHIMVQKKYRLHRDAYAIVRQDGLLGTKYLEIVPGDPLLPGLGSGESLSKPGKSPVDIDELLQQFKDIATNVEDATDSIRHAIGGDDGKTKLKETFDDLNAAADRMAEFSSTFNRILTNNETNVDSIMSDFKNFSHDLKDGWPTMQQSIERISDVVDRDFQRLTDKFESTAESLEEAAIQARQGLRSFGEVADKLNEGRGLLGKLITEDETYHDIKYAVQGLKNYFAKMERVGIVFDAHSEAMWGKAEYFYDPLDEDFYMQDAKGYFGVRIHPTEDYFFVMQGVSSRKGWIEREHIERVVEPILIERIDESLRMGDEVTTTSVPVTIMAPEPGVEHITTRHQRDSRLRWNLQLAKAYKDLAIRFGLFESSAGVAIDYDLPLHSDSFRWITSIELYDFLGDYRINDGNPHLKWLNRVFVFDHLYMTFGADDFISKHNANAFFGVGLRFGDDDIKYLVSKAGTGSLLE